MIIIILAILAVVAIPQYYNLTTDANSAAEAGVVGGVRTGVFTYFAKYRIYPSILDSAANAACTSANACFTAILSQGAVRTSWTKVSATQYTGPTATNYVYTSSAGSFQ